MAKDNRQTCFTFALDDARAEQLRDICEGRGFEPYDVNYARYAFHGNGASYLRRDRIFFNGFALQFYCL
jgi:hypothetical protein